jgi:hypothetical protein
MIRLIGQDIVDYIWKPILLWAKIRVLLEENNFTESSHIDITYYDSSEIEIDLNKIDNYELYELASSTDTYSIRSNVNNDFYYARIKAFHNDIYWTPSRQILLSPQKEADKIAPEFEFNETISLPINRIKEYNFTYYIYENSGIANIEEIYVDFDLEIDSDWDWNTKNDNDNDENNIISIININSESTWSIIQEADKIALEFWPYDYVDKKQIRIMAKDNNNNIWYKDVDFEIYAPDLSIESIDNNIIKWKIKDTLWIESVWFYRIRSWEETRLKNDSDSDLVYSDIEGNFEFNIWNTASGVILTNSWTKIAEINEYTWKITIYDEDTTSINIEIWNSIVYPKISIVYNDKDIYSQYINAPEVTNIKLVSNFKESISDWIFVILKDKINYNYYKIWAWVPYNQWTFVIYNSSDDNKKSIFSIFVDWRIDINNPNFEIKYAYYWDNIVYSLYDSLLEIEVAKVLIKVDSKYVIEKNN